MSGLCEGLPNEESFGFSAESTVSGWYLTGYLKEDYCRLLGAARRKDLFANSNRL